MATKKLINNIKNNKIMKNLILNNIKAILAIALFFVICPVLIAQPPPPGGGGVPLDAGISLLVVAAVGYGASKMKKNNEV